MSATKGGKKNADTFTLTKIVVPTQADKVKLIDASRYLHYLKDIDTSDGAAVNTLAHLYLRPDLIVVEPKE